MFSFKYNYELNKLFKSRKAISHKFELSQKAAHSDELDDLLYEEHLELVLIDDQIHRVVTDRLWEEAKKAMIPIPKHEDKIMWEETETKPGTFHLTVEGINILRSALRNENKDRWDAAVKWIISLTGLVGAVTGLLAIILK